MPDGKPKVVWECPYWHVEERGFTGPDGKARKWWTARRPNPHTVHMLGITHTGYVPLLRQWRVPLQTWVWELPAGLCDIENEKPEQTAQRELIEETGYASSEIHHLLTATVSPGLTDELYNAYLCLELEKAGEGGGTGSERIEVHLSPLWDLRRFLLEQSHAGQLVDCKIFTHLALAIDQLGQLAQEAYERTGEVESRYGEYLGKLMYDHYLREQRYKKPE